MNDVERFLEQKGRGQFDGFVLDEDRRLAKVQEREFLNNCTKPAVGQRVEVYFTVKDLPACSFFLSGEVTLVKAPPIENIRPMEDCGDKGTRKGSMGVSGALVPRGSCSNIPTVHMSQLRYGKFCPGCRGVHMSRSTWENEVPDEIKQETFEKMLAWHSPYHGQQVVCAVRLHYHWDMKRGTDDGPWNDGIPFDGRDVWQLTLEADDYKQNYWTFQHGSLVNLGRNAFPRCWPWTSSNESPYTRDGVDRFSPNVTSILADWPFDYIDTYDGPTTPMEDLLRVKARGKFRASVDDSISRQMERIQGREFLRNRVLARVGQRVEITFKVRDFPGSPFLLSGEVIKVHPAPSPMCGIRPMQDCEDRGQGKGSMDLSGMIAPWVPCPTCRGNNCDGATINYNAIEWGHFCKSCGGLHGSDWEAASESFKEKAFAIMLTWGAQFHGQQVDCAVRLHYHWDTKRGTDEGPWNDGIPFDGRDVWHLSLVADDSKNDVWTFKPGSLVKLERNQFPRCWPWTKEEELPYERDGVDRFDADTPDSLPLCEGPHGCEDDHGRVHEHDLATAA